MFIQACFLNLWYSEQELFSIFITSCRGHVWKTKLIPNITHSLFLSLMCNFCLAKKKFLLEITELFSCVTQCKTGLYYQNISYGKFKRLRRLSSLEQNIRSKLALILSEKPLHYLSKVSYSFLIHWTKTFQTLVFVNGLHAFISVVIICTSFTS